MPYDFKQVSQTLNFKTGEETCAYDKGQFCRFFYVKNFGQTGFCTLYQTDLKLEPSSLVILRCDKCKEDFKC